MKEKIIIGGLGGLSAYLLGLNWELIFIWAIIVVLDVLSGIIKGKKLGFNSSKFKHGLLQKAYEALLVTTLLILDRALMLMGIGISLGSIIIGAFILVDVYSIFENGVALGVRVPKVIKNYVDKANAIVNETDKKGHKTYED